mmetsp:Transcript_34018/g.71558  ORF Transcript_34018/g.71558 Transcript_34018/m.71558 type:complete len:1178 (+) Transcript_34018:23-3556(+)
MTSSLDETSSAPISGSGRNNTNAPSHPGTSGRSPPPPRGTSAAIATGGATGLGIVGAPSAAAGAGGNRPSSLDPHHPGRMSYGSALHGMRLSYGGASSALSSSDVPSPPSTASTRTNSRVNQSDFFAALSPATTKYLRGQTTTTTGGANASSSARGEGSGGGDPLPETPLSPSMAAANAMQTAANAARGIGAKAKRNTGDGNANNGDSDNHKQPRPNALSANDPFPKGQECETIRLRSFVQSLLGMRLPTNNTPSSSIPLMTTPDPTTASFYATSLLTQTSVTGNGRTSYRPDDAYLAARALSLNGEHKRAIWILDRVGLIGFGMGNGDAGGGGGALTGEGDAGAGALEFPHRTNRPADHDAPAISNEEGIRNALLLRAEAALLAGQCLVRAGEYERALAVYEEAMRYPPPPPPLAWGRYGYGYRVDGFQSSNNNGANDAGGGDDGQEEEEGGLDAKLAEEMYIRTWREQSLSHVALIDDGDDERLLQLAANLRPLPFSDAAANNNATTTVEGIHPIARLCTARGIAYDELSNPHRALPFLRMALAIDARCMEALDYAVRRRLLPPEEEKEWISSLHFGSGEEMERMGISWLRDAYLARLRGSGAGIALPPTALQEDTQNERAANVHEDNNILGASPVPRSELQSPSMLSLGSPDFAGGAAPDRGGGGTNDATAGLTQNPFVKKANSISQTVDEAFHSLATCHNLGKSPDILAHAAIRSYATHDLRSALAYCTVIDAIDPFCRTAGYVHVATLVGLGLKRRLFQLAHRLVDTDPKDALAWFAVGSYYYACRRYDLAQRHFSRSTRLDPSCAECWIGFGCSFAVCDESDQALASFRAAQNKYAGSHVPLLYMGMEYLRTNHLSLAGHFLNSAQRTDPSDPLCCNELGVWCYRQGDNMEDAAFWFVKALRLHVRAERSALNSVDEALGLNGYVLLNSGQGDENAAISGDVGRAQQQSSMAIESTQATTPHMKKRPGKDERPPVSTVLCAVKTPSGQSIAASMFSDDNAMMHDGGLTDTECIERCKDPFWEPTIFNLGQSYRKMKRYEEAILCFEKCSSLSPGNYAAYAALGFAKHLSGNVDGAIDSYHEALSRKPEDAFTSEMLTRALAEAVTYPPSLAMLSDFSSEIEGGASMGIGNSILKKMGNSSGRQNQHFQYGNDDLESSMFTSNTNDVDMSHA